MFQPSEGSRPVLLLPSRYFVCVWHAGVSRQYRRAQLPGDFKSLFQEATSKLRTLAELDTVSSEKGAHALQPADEGQTEPTQALSHFCVSPPWEGRVQRGREIKGKRVGFSKVTARTVLWT